jgi:uncharacterized hydrophobic protein (TIGR00271 family)
MTVKGPGDFLGELRLGRQLTTVAQVAIGGLTLLLGLAYLLAGPLIGSLGGWRALVALLVMMIVLSATLANLLELLGGSAERTGIYGLIEETLGAGAGFAAGWSVMAGYIGLLAGLMREAGAHANLYPGIVPYPWLAHVVGPLLLIVLITMQIYRVLPRSEWQRPALIGIGLALLVLALLALPHFHGTLLSAGARRSSADVLRGAAWLSLTFAALEAVLAGRRQIRQPHRRLPPALVACLGAAALLLAAVIVLVAGLTAVGGLPELALTTALAGDVAGLQWFGGLLALLALGLAANVALMTGVRQINSLSLHGLLPPQLRRISGHFKLPPLPFLAILVMTLPLIPLASTGWLVSLAAGLFLVPVVLLNLAAIISRRSEPERRRPFSIPLYPTVPVVGVAGALILLFSLPLGALLGGALFLVAGGAAFLAYGRRHRIEAQEGVLVFGREARETDRPEVYRVLVPLGAGSQRGLTLEIAAALAHQLGGEVIPLQIILTPDPLAIEEGRRLARERNTLFQWSTRMAARRGVEVTPITRLARSVPEGILDTADEESANLILMSWAVHGNDEEAVTGSVLDPVVRRAPCDVAVVAYHGGLGAENAAGEEGGPKLKRLLVPTAGGPHAPLATQMALLLAREFEAAAEVVFVASNEAEESDLEQGEERIRATMRAIHQQEQMLKGGEGLREVAIESRVVRAEGVVEGIAEAGEECDLVLVGSSEESLIDQLLFGTVPEQVARACPSPVVMVKHFRGLSRFWLQRLWDALYAALPSLSRAERVEVYKAVRRGARPDVDFFVMIGLSAIIAVYGLMQDSSAVIIGAMLVAPLFTPILAFSLAIVQGDIQLLRLAVESALKGILLAVGLAFVLALLSPLTAASHEVAARTQPNLFDLAVALASGAAGAYAIARKDVAAALPGVAIAAALVPPLGVVGIGLAMGSAQIAGGSLLLFLTNLVAITFAGSIILLLLGFRPTARVEREARLRLGLIASVVLLLAVSVPLALVFTSTIRQSQTQQTVSRVLDEQLAANPNFKLVSFDVTRRQSEIDVTATVYASQTVPASFAEQLSQAISADLGHPIHLHLVSIPVLEIQQP